MKYDLYSVGEMVIDFTPGAAPYSFIANPGGAPANVAIAMSRLGRETCFCGKLGDDTFGNLLYDVLMQNEVVPLCQARASATTTLAFVHLSEDGERSFTFVRSPGADTLLSASDIKVKDIENASIIHAGSCSLSKQPARKATERAVRLGHGLGKLISFDVNYRSLIWSGQVKEARKAIFKLLPYIDLLKISDEEIFLFGGEEALPMLMQKNRIALAVVTYGSQGARAYWDNNTYFSPGQNAVVSDTNGAGDAFWAAVLTSLLDNHVAAPADLSKEIIQEALICGNVAGCLTVQSYGAVPALPTRLQCRNLYETIMKEATDEL